MGVPGDDVTRGFRNVWKQAGARPRLEQGGYRSKPEGMAGHPLVGGLYPPIFILGKN